MLCPKCNQELPEGSAFCNHCDETFEGDTQPAPAHESAKASIPPVPSEPPTKAKKPLKLLLAVGGGVVALIVLIILASTLKQSPTEKIFKLLDKGDTQAAMAVYRDNGGQGDKINWPDAVEAARKTFQDIQEKYLDSKMSYDNAVAELEKFAGVSFANLDDLYIEIRETIETVQQSREAYAKGKEFESGNDYVQAIQQYLKASEEDNYDEVRTKVKSLLQAIVSDPETYLADSNFNEAFGLKVVREYVDREFKYGYAFADQTILIAPAYYEAEPFADNGLARVNTVKDTRGTNKGKARWGYINLLGEAVIEPQYQEAWDFTPNGLAKVKDMNGSFGLIDEKGAYVIPPNFDKLEEFINGLAIAKDSGHDFEGTYLAGYGFIDEKGEYAVLPKFKEVMPFAPNGIARVKDEQKDLWGYINKSGKYVIQPKYETAHDFAANGLARIEFVDGKIPYEVAMMGWQYAQTWLNSITKYYFINEKGEKISGNYDYARDFSDNGLAAVRKNGSDSLFGYVNSEFEYVIEPKFSTANSFTSNGLALVREGEALYGYINAKGEYVIKPQFKKAESFGENGFASVELYDKKGLIDAEGKFTPNDK